MSKSKRSETPIALVLLCLFCLGGCPMLIEIPYPVEARSIRTEDLTPPGDLYVTLGPRMLIEDVGQRLERRVPNSEFVDPLAFRDVAFPDGGWSVADLTDPDVCSRVNGALSVRYAVLLEVGPQTDRDRERSVFFGLGETGYDTEESVLSALIVDMGRSEILCRAESSASGKEVFLLTWAGGYATNPVTEQAVLAGLSDTIADLFMQQHETGSLRFTVLAVEPRYLE